MQELRGLQSGEKWYEHAPEGVVQNEDVKLLWDVNIQYDNVIKARNPDLILVDECECQYQPM